MNKVLYIILISLFSFTVISCSEKEESTNYTIAPVIAEVTVVTTPTKDTTPNYQFSSTAAGTITYGGSCSSGTTSATSGNNTITFIALSDGTYSDCTIIVTDSAGIPSNTLAVTTFTVSTTSQMGGAIQGRELSLSTAVTTFAGTGTAGSTDHATGTSATFRRPEGITTDGTNLYVAEYGNNRIRKIVIDNGTVTTLAGSSYGFADATGTSAKFKGPVGITTDGTNLYLADSENNKIRKIVIDTGTVTTLAGSGSSCSSDCDGAGTSAGFKYPYGITTDGTNLYVADLNSHTVRKIVIDTGTVTTLAGTGSSGSTDATGTSASFYNPTSITTDGTNLYVAEVGNDRIRKIVISTGVVTTLAGSSSGFADNATGTSAKFNNPRGITTDGTNLYVAEYGNNRIRKIVIDNGTVTTLAGSSLGFADNATGTSAKFNRPWGTITTDGTNLYVSDTDNHRIRKIE